MFGKSGKRKFCQATLWPLALTLCFAATGRAVESQHVRHVAPGWQVQIPGYFMDEPAGRDVLSGWTADHEALKVYKATLEEAEKKVAAADNRIAALSRRVKVQARKWPIGLGLFAGVNCSGQGVIGAGLVILFK